MHFDLAQDHSHDLKIILCALTSEAGGTGGTESLITTYQYIKIDDDIILTFDLLPS